MDVRRQVKAVLLIGPPGAGKTTVRKMTMKRAHGRKPKPKTYSFDTMTHPERAKGIARQKFEAQVDEAHGGFIELGVYSPARVKGRWALAGSDLYSSPQRTRAKHVMTEFAATHPGGVVFMEGIVILNQKPFRDQLRKIAKSITVVRIDTPVEESEKRWRKRNTEMVKAGKLKRVPPTPIERWHEWNRRFDTYCAELDAKVRRCATHAEASDALLDELKV